MQEMADVPVAVNEGLDRRLLEGRLRVGTLCPVEGPGQFIAAEEGTPFGGNRVRRLFPEEVLGFEPCGAHVIEKAHRVTLGRSHGVSYQERKRLRLLGVYQMGGMLQGACGKKSLFDGC